MRKVESKIFTFILFLFILFLFSSCSDDIPKEVLSKLKWNNTEGEIITFSSSEFSDNTNYISLSYDKAHKTIYGANNNNKTIDILDLDGNVKETISGFIINGISYGYKSVTNVFVSNNMLFVCSNLDNRVDIYNTNTKGIIMSLGDGSSNSSKFASTSLPNPKSVVVNDSYIFVSSYGNMISVYKVSDAERNNHLKCNKHAFLRLSPSNDIKAIELDRNSQSFMEIIGDELFLSSEDKTQTFVFNILNLSNGEIRFAKEMLNFSSRFYAIKSDGKYVFISQSPNTLLLLKEEDFLSIMKKESDLNWNEVILMRIKDIQFKTFPQPKNILLLDNYLFFTTSNTVWKIRMNKYEI